jgi:minichromosome maintenance protein 10
MYGRTYISPSALYSIIRLQPNKQAYDVPVDGDFVLIAVVAERGPIRMSKAPVGIEREAEDEGACSDDEHVPVTSLSKDTKPWDKGKRGKGKNTAMKDEPAARKSRKYVNLKLIDFGARSASSATGGKAVLRGDAFLSLLLFESEKVDDIVDEDTGKKKRVYRGGSRGAFETMSTLREGSVIALLNPRVLRPFQVSHCLYVCAFAKDHSSIQRASDAPHPTANVLGLTPESAESTLVLGYARDLGLCAVVRKDGKTCGAWTDKRVSDVCEYHVTHAVQHLRAGRAEFSQG